MLNSYKTEDILSMDTSVSSTYGEIVASINNNAPTLSPLMFLTPRKILNDRVHSVYNETQDFYYNLTGMSIINDQVIDLDFSVNTLGLSTGDIVRVKYSAVDYTNEYDHLLSVQDSGNLVLFSTISISEMHKIYNFTKNEEYSLEGDFLIENNKVIYLDNQAGDNALIGLDQGDIIFASYIAKNDSEISGTRGYTYHRTTSQGENTASVHAFQIDVVAGDYINIKSMKESGTNNARWKAGACRVTVEQVN